MTTDAVIERMKIDRDFTIFKMKEPARTVRVRKVGTALHLQIDGKTAVMTPEEAKVMADAIKDYVEATASR